MASVMTQLHPASAAPLDAAVADATDSSGPKAWGDMTVEMALSVMAGARIGYLPVCDEDDLCTGLVTQAQLTVVRDSATYTDRLRLRDLIGPVPAAPAGMAGTGYAA
ncbi:CBS domain-containing protein [Streptomyces sp. NPDC058299]|uniref:CBS domain-containing protein n=1 Tax=Streptomyces sp. NPDC058299 TaxID=3346435 RepID=UPI0036E2B7E1